MKNFWAYISNSQYSVGTTGQTVYLFDSGNEINKFKDITYGYTPMFSPNGKFFVVKSTEGSIAVYSLESYSLIKKFRFSKVHEAQDDGFCFSPDSRLFINVERQGNSQHSAISVYETENFSRITQLLVEKDMMIGDIEFDNGTNDYYVLGFVRGDYGYSFIAKYKENSISDIVKISDIEYDFYRSYLNLKTMGFTEKAYQWSSMDCELEKLKNMNHSLAKLHSYHKTKKY